MQNITCIILSNTNNQNQTDVHTSATPETVSSILFRNGWVETSEGSMPRRFVKDRVIVTMEQRPLIEDADVALRQLFFG